MRRFHAVFMHLWQVAIAPRCAPPAGLLRAPLRLCAIYVPSSATRHRLCGHFMTRLRRHVTQRMDDDTPQSERREALVCVTVSHEGGTRRERDADRERRSARPRAITSAARSTRCVRSPGSRSTTHGLGGDHRQDKTRPDERGDHAACSRTRSAGKVTSLTGVDSHQSRPDSQRCRADLVELSTHPSSS